MLNAAKFNQPFKMQKLLTKHNVNTCDAKGISLLKWASLKGNQQICEILLKEGALVDIQDHENRTALHYAANNGHVHVCTLLLKNNAHVNQQTNTGTSPLYAAAQNGHAHICSVLLESNALVNQQRNTGESPLYIAAHEGHVHVCTLLLEKNANVNQQRNDGTSPLYVAAHEGHIHVCILLLERSVHVNQQKNTGASPLHIAARNGHFHVCTILLENKANVNQQTKDGLIPLMAASGSGHAKVCECLLQNDAAINHKSKYGDNALYWAVSERKYDVCKLLLQHGADVNNVNNKGESIFDVANTIGDQNIITLIREHYNNTKVNKELIEARKKLRILEIKQITEAENRKARACQLSRLLLQKQEEKDRLETQLNSLINQTNKRTKKLSEPENENSPAKYLLQRQNAGCEAVINDILDQISGNTKSIDEYNGEIKTLESMTITYEQQKEESEFYNKCVQDEKCNKIVNDLNKECPICFEEMQPPIKIFQCSEGHILCENCFKKIIESTKTCPFCGRDVASSAIRNRALEEVIDNQARRDIGAAS